MFIKLLTLVFAIGLLTQSELSWGENYDFRLTKWGMTQNDVISAEKKMDPVERTENMITYKTQISNKNVVLNYLFAQDKLIGALYKLDDNYLNSDHFMQTYLQFKQVVTKKYGPPSREITNWLNDTYRNNRKKWGLALSLGHTEYATIWKTPDTTIECSLREDNLNVQCLMEYWSIEYSHLLEEVKKEGKIDLF
jgi:predicted porin